MFLTCVYVYAQSCPTLCDPSDCSPPNSSVYGIFQARVLEWVAISYSRGSSRPRDWTRISCVSCAGRWILHHCATWEALNLRDVMLKPTTKVQILYNSFIWGTWNSEIHRSQKVEWWSSWVGGRWEWGELKVKVAQSCLTLCDPMDHTVHGILQ